MAVRTDRHRLRIPPGGHRRRGERRERLHEGQRRGELGDIVAAVVGDVHEWPRCHGRGGRRGSGPRRRHGAQDADDHGQHQRSAQKPGDRPGMVAAGPDRVCSRLPAAAVQARAAASGAPLRDLRLLDPAIGSWAAFLPPPPLGDPGVIVHAGAPRSGPSAGASSSLLDLSVRLVGSAPCALPTGMHQADRYRRDCPRSARHRGRWWLHRLRDRDRQARAARQSRRMDDQDDVAVAPLGGRLETGDSAQQALAGGVGPAGRVRRRGDADWQAIGPQRGLQPGRIAPFADRDINDAAGVPSDRLGRQPHSGLMSGRAAGQAQRRHRQRGQHPGRAGRQPRRAGTMRRPAAAGRSMRGM